MASDLDRLLVEALRGGTYTPTPQNVKNVVPAPLAGMLGAPGDIQAMAQWAGNKLAPLLAKQPGGNLISAAMGMAQGHAPTTEQLGAALGANPSSPEFQVASFGAPDMSDVGRIGLAQALFHGTPHRFDKFDISKIGTGEGHQAFGRGLYFAENPEVAGEYASNITSFPFGNKNFAEDLIPIDDELMRAQVRLEEMYGAKEIGADQKIIDDAINKQEDLIDSLFKKRDQVIKDNSYIYEVKVPDEIIAQMLDFDAKLGDQIEVFDKLFPDTFLDEFISPPDGIRPSGFGKNMPGPFAKYGKQLKDWTGEDVLDHFSVDPKRGVMGRGYSEAADEAARAHLEASGIRGVRYLDEKSRGKGKGTRNIVVFNPDDITQVKRDGELVYENTDLAKALRDGK